MGVKIVPLLLIILGILLRLLPHPPNFAPITALGLFGGVYLQKKYAFILPLTALLISDLVIGFYGTMMLFVYGSFILSGLIGLWVKKHKTVTNVFLASLLSSILFYLITNFGVWLMSHSYYTKDLTGLLQSYILAIPFFRNTLLGDLFYAGLFFGSLEFSKLLAKRFLPPKLLTLLY